MTITLPLSLGGEDSSSRYRCGPAAFSPAPEGEASTSNHNHNNNVISTFNSDSQRSACPSSPLSSLPPTPPKKAAVRKYGKKRKLDSQITLDSEELSRSDTPSPSRPSLSQRLPKSSQSQQQPIPLPPSTSQPPSYSSFGTLPSDIPYGLARVGQAIREARRIIVISGAGISTPQIPDFRSATGLFKTLAAGGSGKGQGGEGDEGGEREGEGKGKGKEGGSGSQTPVITSGKELFDVKCLTHPDLLPLHHSLLNSLTTLSNSATPSTFHHYLSRADREGRLLRVYTQNIDGLEEKAGLRCGIPEEGSVGLRNRLERKRGVGMGGAGNGGAGPSKRKGKGKEAEGEVYLGEGLEGSQDVGVTLEESPLGSQLEREVGNPYTTIPSRSTSVLDEEAIEAELRQLRRTQSLLEPPFEQQEYQNQSHSFRPPPQQDAAVIAAYYSQDDTALSARITSSQTEMGESPPPSPGLPPNTQDTIMSNIDEADLLPPTQVDPYDSPRSVSTVETTASSKWRVFDDPAFGAKLPGPIQEQSISYHGIIPPMLPRCIPLHGMLSHLQCTRCSYSVPLADQLPLPLEMMPCPSCATTRDERIDREKRPRSVGLLRASVVLYGEEHKHGESIGAIVESDLIGRSKEDGKVDLVIVAGTTLQIPGVKRMIKEFARVVKSHRPSKEEKAAAKRKAEEEEDEEDDESDEDEQEDEAARETRRQAKAEKREKRMESRRERQRKEDEAAAAGQSSPDEDESEEYPIRTILLNRDPPSKGKSGEWADVFDVWVQGDLQQFTQRYVEKGRTPERTRSKNPIRTYFHEHVENIRAQAKRRKISLGPTISLTLGEGFANLLPNHLSQLMVQVKQVKPIEEGQTTKISIRLLPKGITQIKGSDDAVTKETVTSLEIEMPVAKKQKGGSKAKSAEGMDHQDRKQSNLDNFLTGSDTNGKAKSKTTKGSEKNTKLSANFAKAVADPKVKSTAANKGGKGKTGRQSKEKSILDFTATVKSAAARSTKKDQLKPKAGKQVKRAGIPIAAPDEMPASVPAPPGTPKRQIKRSSKASATPKRNNPPSPFSSNASSQLPTELPTSSPSNGDKKDSLDSEAVFTFGEQVKERFVREGSICSDLTSLADEADDDEDRMMVDHQEGTVFQGKEEDDGLSTVAVVSRNTRGRKPNVRREKKEPREGSRKSGRRVEVVV